ncbi:MarR family winged helix-turn-helix transcriptional regulator [Yoonia sp. SS1-5]|uniref:MarR family winged helix-turn-helix transcriptional regulator n=1 Tax=Yoonia rhodophyticola TaxID=3137370 RepID=A0AAN0MDH1_9RHOB
MDKVTFMTNFSDFDLKDFTPYLLNLAAEASSLGFQKHYKEKYGMLRTEWRVVFHLGQYGPMHAKEICNRARIHKTKVSRAVAALEKKRFLKREQESDDRRHEKLSLTRPGMVAFRDLLVAAQRFDDALVEEFSQHQRDILRKCLTRIARLTD